MKKFLCVLTMLSIVFSSFTFMVTAADVTADIIPNRSFDTATDLTGWTPSKNTGAANELTIVDSAMKVNFDKTGVNYWADNLSLKFDSAQTGIIEQCFDIYIPDSKMNLTASIIDGSDTNKAMFIMSTKTTDNTITLKASADHNYGTYKKSLTNSWYSFKIIYDTNEHKRYVYYKEQSADSWTFITQGSTITEDAFKGAYSDLAGIKGIYFNIESAQADGNSKNFYIDNYRARTISSGEFYAETIKSVLHEVDSKTVTLSESQNMPFDPSWTAANDGGINVIDFSITTPTFDATTIAGSATLSVAGKSICAITGTGQMRKSIGTNPWSNTNAVLESNTKYDIKVVLYTDTSVFDLYYKKTTDTEYTNFSDMGTNTVSMADYRTNYSTAGSFSAPAAVRFAMWKAAAGQSVSVTVEDFKVTNFAKAADMLAYKGLFESYYAQCGAAGITSGNFATTDNVFASMKSEITALALNTNEGILANAAPLADVLDVCSTDYKDYKTVSSKMVTAKASAAKLVANGIYTTLSEKIKKVDLFDSLQACENAEKAAGMRIYISDNTAVADTVFVGNSGIAFIAAYNDQKEFLGVSNIETIELNAETSKEKQVTFVIPTGATVLKAFAWDSLDKLNPVCANLEIAAK